MEEKKEDLQVRETPVMDNKVEGLKITEKAKPKKLTNKKQSIPKIDLNKKEEKDAVQKSSSEKVDVLEIPGDGKEVGETHAKSQSTTQETQKEEVQVIQEITEEKPVIPEPVKAIPEGVDKLVDFMKNTGGNMEDYIRLNADYSTVDDVTLLKEYYKNTKPHLDSEEIEFLLDDKFSYDEDYDEDKDIRKKKLAIKEEVFKANAYLDDLKSKYYQEIKLRPGATQDQIKATDFFNRYNNEQKQAKTLHENFIANTKKHFSEDFKGFDFNLGEKKFRYNVTNPNDVANQQSDIQNFVKTFLNKDGTVNDYTGYHKAIYAARNADTIANHFYEQGKADAIQNVVSNTKNIDNSARSSQPADHIYLNGLRIKSVTGANSSKLKINKKR